MNLCINIEPRILLIRASGLSLVREVTHSDLGDITGSSLAMDVWGVWGGGFFVVCCLLLNEEA